MHLFKKIYYQHVRNAVLAVCAKPVPVLGRRREIRGLLRGESYLDMSFYTNLNFGSSFVGIRQILIPGGNSLTFGTGVPM